MKTFRPLIWCALAMLGVSSVVSIFAFGAFLKKELFFRWFLNLFNAYLSAAISRKAVGRELIAFLAWSFLGHGIRFFAVLIVTGIAIMTGWGHQAALIVFILTGYLIFTLGEVVILLHLNE